MEAQLQRILFETLSEVFEKMFFTVLEPLPASSLESAPQEDYYEAEIRYRSGSSTGVFRFFFPDPLADHITVNFLGAEEGLPAEHQVLDTVKETANMAVGSLLGKVDPEGACQLGIPQARRRMGFVPAELAGHPGLRGFNSLQGMLWLVYEAD